MGDPLPYRVFVNAIDSFQGQYVTHKLTNLPAFKLGGDDSHDASEEFSDDGPAPFQPLRKIEVIGCLSHESHKDYKQPAWVTTVVGNERGDLLAASLECDVVIFDIMDGPDDFEWLAEELAIRSDDWEKDKTLVCLSTVLTWGKTQITDALREDIDEFEDDDQRGLTEEDYRMRKADPFFKQHLHAEKIAMDWSYKKANLSAYVVARGLLYGQGEHIFHYIFKSAWHHKPKEVPFFNLGIVPTIHVLDFAAVVASVLTKRPKTKYIVAVDDSMESMHEIVQAVSDALGTGDKPRRVRHDDKFIERECTQTMVAMLRADIRIEGMCIKDLDIAWHAEGGMVENLRKVVREYRVERGLTPIKICLAGPPASGKTHLSKILKSEYKLCHVTAPVFIKEYLNHIAEDPEAEDILLEIEEEKEENGGRYSDEQLATFARYKLRSTKCQNQGFILDGFPKTKRQADLLFHINADEETSEDRVEDDGDGDDGDEQNLDARAMPDFFVSLEVSDDFARKRVMDLPEKDVAGTHNTREGLNRRLVSYRAANNATVSVRDFFEENAVKVLVLNAENISPKNMASTVRETLGPPHNYGPSERDLHLAAEMKRDREMEAEYAIQRAHAEGEKAERVAREASELAWRGRLAAVRDREHEVLNTQSKPLKEFLIEHVLPTVKGALAEVCKVRPDDPVDYLAAYLFKNNPIEEGEDDDDAF